MDRLVQALPDCSAYALLRSLVEADDWLPSALGRVSVEHVVTDSRDVVPGDVFVALSGLETDGRRFIGNAVAAGAVLVLQPGDEFDIREDDGYWLASVPDLSRHLLPLLQLRYSNAASVTLLAVTGTNGKSSITQYVAQLATELGYGCGVIGTVGNGVWPHLSPTRNTTPGIAVMYRVLDEFARHGARFAAVEVSSHGLDQGRVDGLKFAVVALTNLTQDHLDYHGDMESYFLAKRRLFTDFGVRNALVNADDEYGQRLMSDLAPELPIFPVTSSVPVASGDACVGWSLDGYGDFGMKAQIRSPWGERQFDLPLIGDFNLANTAMAIGMLASQGVSFDALVEAAERLRPVAGRMELFCRTESPTVVLDFAHTPDALKNVLQSLARWSKPITLVYGCGGDRDRSKRPLMTEIALKHAQTVILTDDNPRYEDPDQIWADALSVEGTERIHCEHNRQLAIEYAVSIARSNELIVIAGKGHEDYQDICGEKLPFSDLNVLNELGYRRAGEECDR